MSACVASIEKTGCRWATEELFPRWSAPGVPVIDTSRFRQAEVAQRTWGDYLLTLRTGEVVSVEVKTEAKWTGNLFLESWSNRTAEGKYRRDGWLLTLHADVLLYLFLDAGAAVTLRVPDLRKWALDDGNLYRYKETAVKRSLEGEQLNMTVGFLVPVADLVAAVGAVRYRRRDGVWRQV